MHDRDLTIPRTVATTKSHQKLTTITTPITGAQLLEFLESEKSTGSLKDNLEACGYSVDEDGAALFYRALHSAKGDDVSNWDSYLATAPEEPLTGDELLAYVKSLQDSGVDKAQLCIGAGYYVFKAPAYSKFYTAMLDAKGIELESDENKSAEDTAAENMTSEERVTAIATELKMTKAQVNEAYDWDWDQTMQNVLFLVDRTHRHIIATWNSIQENTTEKYRQQCLNDLPRLIEEVELRAKQMCISIGPQNASCVTADAFGVMQHLYAYNFSDNWNADGTAIPRDVQRESFDKVLAFVAEDAAFKSAQAITNGHLSPEAVKDYEKFRFDHWTETANVLRTYISDLVNGSPRATHTNSDRYRADMREASIWLHMFDENCEWSIWGILSLMCATFRYASGGEAASDQQVKEMGTWLSELKDAGGEVRKEIAENPAKQRGQLNYAALFEYDIQNDFINHLNDEQKVQVFRQCSDAVQEHADKLWLEKHDSYPYSDEFMAEWVTNHFADAMQGLWDEAFYGNNYHVVFTMKDGSKVQVEAPETAGEMPREFLLKQLIAKEGLDPRQIEGDMFVS